ncbi:hypothetical protein LCGC14_0460990 [marine sediment metagenome]|uniref:Uncharacterized protein n=1 Tax=marine sediment metagenome TaxID=412755 RepID=A0A0F9SXY2_9ZZZZ|nr:hypothetical protein [bacterium]
MKPTTIFGLKVPVVLLFFVGFVLIVISLFESCPTGRESPEYFKLKGEFEVYKAEAEEAARAVEASDAVTKKENAELRNEIDELEISKGLILAESADRNKKIFEQSLELKELQEKESSITSTNELVLNLRAQISTLEGNFSLAIEDRDKEKKARKLAESEAVKLEGIIKLRDETIGVLRPALAAERVARLAAEAVISTGEKNSVFFKIGKLVGSGFKLYGIYASVRDTVKAASK